MIDGEAACGPLEGDRQHRPNEISPRPAAHALAARARDDAARERHAALRRPYVGIGKFIAIGLTIRPRPGAGLPIPSEPIVS